MADDAGSRIPALPSITDDWDTTHFGCWAGGCARFREYFVIETVAGDRDGGSNLP